MSLPHDLGAPRGATDPLHRCPPAVLAVLLVDDEATVLEELSHSLKRQGLAVLTAGSAAAALAVLEGRPDVGTLVSDIRMPDMDGLALARAALRARGEAQALEVVLVTGDASPAHGVAASRLGAFGLLHKPMRGTDLARVVEAALASAAARRGGEPRAARLGMALARRPSYPAPAAPASASAAEALLRMLALRIDADGNGFEAVAADLHGPLGDLLRAAPEAHPNMPARLLGLLDDLLDAAAAEASRAPSGRAPISAQGMLGAVAERLTDMGLRCGRRLTLQPEADTAFRLDTPRLLRAVALLAGLAIGGPRPRPGTAELSIDAGIGQARLDLVIRPAELGGPPPEPLPEAERRLPLAIAHRLVALQGGRLDAWMLPEGGLRARLLLRGA